jgi:ABC-type multidrug transport system fused ATPase/permease subunit
MQAHKLNAVQGRYRWHRPQRVNLSVAAAAATAVKTAGPQWEIPRGNTAGTVLEVEDVTVAVGEVDLLVGVDWKMLPGQRVGLVGANGCGKSTLLKSLCGMRPIHMGELQGDARRLPAPPPPALATPPPPAARVACTPLAGTPVAGSR